ncbi:histidine phosphatase superfamily [Pisolithus orientalis]|uniref:histidine phosphatase superfamily n=1 Tax=Pisolithus orientalis TaxID=936130 RepID=UPI0022249EF6|nr:histidine phosphatase superfamily [Pisolithus orientalis]KAI6005332.1 histidine phosphatase superfamily [Pisolithus orientalis]
MIETIYIARHGFRSNWVDPICGSPTGLPRDYPLAAYGETQAQELAAYFQALPVSNRPTAIFSSPYYRCLQTALPMASALNLPIYTEHGIAEWYSPVVPGTGLHPRPKIASELKAYFTEIDPSWSSVWYPSRKGEDVDQVHARVNGFLELFVPEVERRFSDKHKCILLFSHAATIIALCRGLLAQPDMPLRVGCCSISVFTRKPGAVGIVGAWEPELLANGDHLKDGASRDWGFEDIHTSNRKVINHVGIPGTEHLADDTCGPQIQRSSL